MKTLENISPGMTEESHFRVMNEHSAQQVGSGSLPVLATPILIIYSENLCHRMLADRLPSGNSSVGVAIDVRHVAPTPIGAMVRIQAQIEVLENNQVGFFIQAWDQSELIFEGHHKRSIIDEARFLNRVKVKSDNLQSD